MPKLKPFVSPIVQPKSPPATPPIAEINTQNLLNLGINIYPTKVVDHSKEFSR